MLAKQWRTFQAALIFYTALPWNPKIDLDFRGIAIYAPSIGVLIGALLGGVDWTFGYLPGMAGHASLRAGAIALLGVWLTGGLHLDGAMDTADGLAVTDRDRRLTIMADSHTGAYGAIAAIAILLLKTLSLAALPTERWWILVSVSAWARWGQLLAIANYPYLKASGKGKFHREAIRGWHVWVNGILLIGTNLLVGIGRQHLLLATQLVLAGLGLAWLTGAWLARKLGGHTGDTYGAIVEWTETLNLGVIAAIGIPA